MTFHASPAPNFSTRPNFSTSPLARPATPHPYCSPPGTPNNRPLSAEARFKQIYGSDIWAGLHNRSFVVSLLSTDDAGDTDTEYDTDRYHQAGKERRFGVDFQKVQVTTAFRVVPLSPSNDRREGQEAGGGGGEEGTAKAGDYELLVQVVIPPKDGEGNWKVRSYAAYIPGQLPVLPSSPSQTTQDQILAHALRQLPKCFEQHGISLEVYPADDGEGQIDAMLVHHSEPRAQDSALPLLFEAVPAPVKEAFLSIDFFEHVSGQRLDKMLAARVQEEEQPDSAIREATKQNAESSWQNIKKLGENLDRKIKAQQETRLAFKKKLEDYAKDQRKQQAARTARNNPSRILQIA